MSGQLRIGGTVYDLDSIEMTIGGRKWPSDPKPIEALEPCEYTATCTMKMEAPKRFWKMMRALGSLPRIPRHRRQHPNALLRKLCRKSGSGRPSKSQHAAWSRVFNVLELRSAVRLAKKPVTSRCVAGSPLYDATRDAWYLREGDAVAVAPGYVGVRDCPDSDGWIRGSLSQDNWVELKCVRLWETPERERWGYVCIRISKREDRP